MGKLLDEFVAERYTVDVAGFLKDIIDWQGEVSTESVIYNILDSVIDIFIDNCVEE